MNTISAGRGILGVAWGGWRGSRTDGAGLGASRQGACGSRQRVRGFTLIELMITLVIVSILGAVAYPSYIQYIVRASRQAAQSELVGMANLQEKIYLNSNAYAASVTADYNGTSAGGLGKTSGLSEDGKYGYTVTSVTPFQSYTITATPVAGGAQANDGNLTISSTGAKTWGSATW
jgi:type IV pilus assembly protein PilE